ncbi:MAG: Cache 3/Cache 2 fusion domain-containing protein [Candidatus Omnitrophica bacterium]|nr:Cache 3/Cache 2 fusion domain-containing protein [Candidatus Omnitrophota bacterium]
MQLRFKLFVSHSTLALVPLVLFGLLAYWNTAASFLRIADDQVRTILDKSIEQMEGLIRVGADNTEALAKMESARTAFRLAEFDSDMSQMRNYYQDYLKTHAYLRNIRLVTVDGKEVISAADLPPGKKINYTALAWFARALNSEGIYFVDLHVSPEFVAPVLLISYPVFDGKNTIGLLVADIDGGQVTDFINGLRLGQTGYGYIINNAGTLIAHPKREKIFVENLSNSPSETLRAAVAQMRSLETGKSRYTYEGVDKYVFYRPYRNLGWSVGLTIPVSELLSGARTLIRFDRDSRRGDYDRDGFCGADNRRRHH